MIRFRKEEDYGNGIEVTTVEIEPTNNGAITRLTRDGWIREE